MRARFESSPANVLGVVLNGVSRRPAFYHSYYQTPPSSGSKPPSGLLGKLRDVLKGLGTPSPRSDAPAAAFSLRSTWDHLRQRARALVPDRLDAPIKSDEPKERVA
jgi:hypothetical protein